jgi:hypothetical protein
MLNNPERQHVYGAQGGVVRIQLRNKFRYLKKLTKEDYLGHLLGLGIKPFVAASGQQQS